MGTTTLGWTLCGVLLAGGAYWLWLNSRKTKAEPAPDREVEVLRQLAGRRGLGGDFRSQSFGTLRRISPGGPASPES